MSRLTGTLTRKDKTKINLAVCSFVLTANERGYESATVKVPKGLVGCADDLFMSRLTFTDTAGTCWDGYVVGATPDGCDVTIVAAGCWQLYETAPFSASYTNSSLLEIVTDWLEHLKECNPDLISDCVSMIVDPGIEFTDDIEDAYLTDWLEEQLIITGSDVAVWECDQGVHFRPRNRDRVRHQVISADIKPNYSIKSLVNCAYAVFKDEDGNRQVTETVTNEESVCQYCLKKCKAVQVNTTDPDVALAYAEATVADGAFPPSVSSAKICSDDYPCPWQIKPGDVVAIEGSGGACGNDVEFVVGRTRYDSRSNCIVVSPSGGVTSLAQVAAGVN